MRTRYCASVMRIPFTKKLGDCSHVENQAVLISSNEGKPCTIPADSGILVWQVIGYVVCSVKSLALHIAHLAVDAKWRRQGIGRRLVLVSS